MATDGIRRAGTPQAVQKIRENYYLVQVALNASPRADWRRLFYDMQQEVPPEFPPRSVEITGTLLRFKSDPAEVEWKIGLIDRWIARATGKEATMGARSEEQKRHREELAREAEEMNQWNENWKKLAPLEGETK